MNLLSHTPSHAAAIEEAHLSDAVGALTVGELSERFGGGVAILIPAYEEAENLADLLPRVPSRICGVAATVLVVDDGSADDTARAALDGGAVVASLPANRGGGAALRVGYALMVAAGAGVVITMDADGQHQPQEIAGLLEPVLSRSAELVQGSRVLGTSEPGAFARELGIALFNRLVRLLTRVRVTDCSNSFRAIRTELLPELDLRQPQFHAAEFLIEALTRGFVFQEVPVSVLSRRHGLSKKPATLRYGLGFSWAIISAWMRSIRRRDPIKARGASAQMSGPPRRDARARARSARLTPDPRLRLAEHAERESATPTETADLEALQPVAERAQQHPEHRAADG